MIHVREEEQPIGQQEAAEHFEAEHREAQTEKPREHDEDAPSAPRRLHPRSIGARRPAPADR